MQTNLEKHTLSTGATAALNGRAFRPSGAEVSADAVLSPSQRQVCLGGEPVHHRGFVQLLRGGGVLPRGEASGEALVMWTKNYTLA